MGIFKLTIRVRRRTKLFGFLLPEGFAIGFDDVGLEVVGFENQPARQRVFTRIQAAPGGS